MGPQMLEGKVGGCTGPRNVTPFHAPPGSALITWKTCSSSSTSSSRLSQLCLGTEMTFSTEPTSAGDKTPREDQSEPSRNLNRVTRRLSLTCSDEHDVILPIGGGHPVHCQPGEGDPGVAAQEDGPAGSGHHGVKHERVIAGELQNVIRKVPGGFEAAECFTGTLQRAERDSEYREELTI